jgi:hypothetical protein
MLHIVRIIAYAILTQDIIHATQGIIHTTQGVIDINGKSKKILDFLSNYKIT